MFDRFCLFFPLLHVNSSCEIEDQIYPDFILLTPYVNWYQSWNQKWNRKTSGESLSGTRCKSLPLVCSDVQSSSYHTWNYVPWYFYYIRRVIPDSKPSISLRFHQIHANTGTLCGIVKYDGSSDVSCVGRNEMLNPMTPTLQKMNGTSSSLLHAMNDKQSLGVPRIASTSF